MQLLLSMVKLTKLEKRMSTRGHYKVSYEIHKRRKEYVKENDIKRRLSDEEFDRELTKVKVQLNVLIERLQKHEEGEKCGCIFKKKVK